MQQHITVMIPPFNRPRLHASVNVHTFRTCICRAHVTSAASMMSSQAPSSPCASTALTITGAGTSTCPTSMGQQQIAPSTAKLISRDAVATLLLNSATSSLRTSGVPVHNGYALTELTCTEAALDEPRMFWRPGDIPAWVCLLHT